MLVLAHGSNSSHTDDLPHVGKSAAEGTARLVPLQRKAEQEEQARKAARKAKQAAEAKSQGEKEGKAEKDAKKG
ncbi:hypothetical protein AB0D66_24720 [Streptomyces sp. NPDC048270]|uniref:hypothetical protein n=1 Tax=Streptomyces sp. NPDC048270 TaxID=3154615 RepID=UPI003401AFD1